MACAIDATVGGAFANSYATVAEATAYFQSRLRTGTWDAATADEQCRAMVSACLLLEAWVDWDGWPATTTQRLAWPRYGLTYVSAAPIPHDALPDGLKISQAELAKALLATDLLAAAEQAVAAASSGQGALTGLKAGSVSLEWATPATGAVASAVVPVAERLLSAAVWGPIQRWATGRRGSSATLRLVRV